MAGELILPNAAGKLILPEDIVETLHTSGYLDVLDMWYWIEQNYGPAGKAALNRQDRYYLLTVTCKRVDAIDPWLYERCREVEAEPDDCLDLWAREHYKSTFITYAGSLQEALNDPDITIAIFSHTRPISKKFLRQIKVEVEQNLELRLLHPDALWLDPARDAPRAGAKWTEERIDFKRTENLPHGTVEAWGLVDGMPISAHFKLRIYDDVVTDKSVTTPEMIEKTTTAWELSDSLGAVRPDGRPGRRWHIGTRYSYADTYGAIIERDILKPRIYAATDDGLKTGKPVFLTEETWEDKKKNNSDAVLACQYLQNPAAGQQAMFDKMDLRFTDIRPSTLNVYIMVDPAGSKKKDSCNTAITVVGVDYARNKFLLDGMCHRMNLKERWTNLKNIRRHWLNQPGVQCVEVGYEKYGMQADIEYMEERMEIEKDPFEIKELNWPNEGPGSKVDRVQRLVPDFKHHKFYIIGSYPSETKNQKKVREAGQPWRVLTPVMRRDAEGKLYALNKMFLNEYLPFPFSTYKDLLDSLSRIYDMNYVPPILINDSDLEPEAFVD